MNGNPSSSMAGAIVAAVVASLCCVAPLMLLTLGISGAWVGSLRAVEPYRPILTIVTVAFLGSAFYQVYRRPRTEQCGRYCGNPRSRSFNKGVLWIVTAMIGGLLSFPYVAVQLDTTPIAAEGSEATRVTLAVENMSCYTCPITVRKSLMQVPGVLEAQITMNPPEVLVVFDPGRVSTRDLIHATASAGYPSSVQENRGP